MHDESHSAQVPEPEDYRTVGVRRRYRRDYYLTADEQRELGRVATHPQPARDVAILIAEAHRRWNRHHLPDIALVGLAVSLIPLCVLVGRLGVFLLSDEETMSPFFAWVFLGLMGWSAVLAACLGPFLMSIPTRDARMVDTLMTAIRAAAETPAPRPDRVASELQTAAAQFYDLYRKETRGKRGPRRHRQLRRGAAGRGAAAINSYIDWLDADQPNYPDLADDLRRAVLRVAAGRWREVEQLGPDRSQPWLPTLRSRLRNVLTLAVQHDLASKITVALIGLLAAMLAAAAVLIKVVNGD